ncbi:MAG: Coenzyme F420 hydrogenase/dehydrogenase, beta subunit C-terminal domain [Methanothrix sp.]|nr:Coenzyme F420 hydrogenase/dehydrogenase, beta subunit C-terminal domain [Methanothrix sp.]
MQENVLIKPTLQPYQELEEKVWQKAICAGCRGCIAVCLADTLAYDYELNKPCEVNPCIECKACLDACPRLPANVERMVSSDVIGPYLDIKNVRSEKANERFQNGGAVIALLTAALEEELVDCALVMGLDRWTQKSYPHVVYDTFKLNKSAGSKYTSNAVLESIKELVKDPKVKNIALVGTPCTVQSVGLLRKSSNEYAVKLVQKVRFLIGLFCFEAFSDNVIPGITKRIGVSPWRIDKMSAGEGQMTVTLRDQSIKSIPLAELDEYVKPGCRACTDFTAKLSDISVGGVGSAPGMSSVITRTPEGMGLFNIAEEMGLLKVSDGVNVEAIKKVGGQKIRRNRIANELAISQQR